MFFSDQVVFLIPYLTTSSDTNASFLGKKGKEQESKSRLYLEISSTQSILSIKRL